MQVTLNGEAKQFPAPLTVRELLEALGLDPRKIAVERNLEIVPRSTYGEIRVGDGDRLEIVHFIGGGNDARPAAAREKEDALIVAGRRFTSRLLVGTGKY
jgi:thiazole synthase